MCGRTWIARHGLLDTDCRTWTQTWIAGHGHVHGLQDTDTDLDCWTWIRTWMAEHGWQNMDTKMDTDMDTDMDMDRDTEMDTDMDTDMQRREGKIDLHNIKLQKAFANILERTCEFTLLFSA